MSVRPEILRTLLAFQRNEITEHHIYLRLAAVSFAIGFLIRTFLGVEI